MGKNGSNLGSILLMDKNGMKFIEINKLIGKRGSIMLRDLTIKVKILNIKKIHGRFKYLVTPLAGSGEIWTEKIRVEVVV